MDSKYSSTNSFIPRVKKGDQPSASQENRNRTILENLMRLQTVSVPRDQPITLVEPNEFMGRVLNSGDAFVQDRSAKILRWDRDDIAVADTELSKETLTDPFDLVYDPSEKLLVMYHEPSGKHFPVNPRTVRTAIIWPQTVDDSEGCGAITDTTYPGELGEEKANTYPIKFIRVGFNPFSGFQEPAISYLNNTLCHDEFAFNIASDEIIPVYSLVQVFNCAGRWYMSTCCVSDEKSSSSSSMSQTSDSSQSLSSRSVSESSRGSSASSSVSRSESSISISASSISISMSSGYDCVDVVTSVVFDPGTCELTYCLRKICFPSNLGIIIHDEVC